MDGCFPVVKGESRVTSVQKENSNAHHATFEADEEALVSEEGTEVTLAQLSNTVGASDEDENGREEEEDEESPHGLVESVLGGRASSPSDVVGEESAEAEESDDLEDEAGKGDVLADLDGSSVCTSRRQGTAHRLQDERDDIGGDEDPVKVSGREPRDRWIHEVDDL